MSRAFPGWPHTTKPDSLWGVGARDWDLPPPRGATQSDVVIVGAGFTGLWTAKFLTDIDPDLSVTVLDAMQPGFGASGRNGGWCSALMPMSLGTVAASSSPQAATALQRSLISAISDIGSFVSDHDIDCAWSHGGTMSIATNPAQCSRAAAMVDEFRAFGFGEDFVRLVDAEEAERRVHTARARGGWFSPHCAALNPVGLVDGLVRVLAERGVHIHGRSLVDSIDARTVRVLTPEGETTVAGRWVVLATEGFTPSLHGFRRNLAPVHSYMIATEPLPAEVWRSIGWNGRETFADGRHVVIYAQRTRDDRIAFGGRGAPYSFGSRIGPRFDTDARIHSRIIRTLHDMFPDVAGAAVTHRWGGALGVPRDWHTSVSVDPARGLAVAGGYVGDGVAFSHVAARAAAHAIAGTGDPVVGLPIVGHVSPRWEPEPLRWLGINSMLRLGAFVDVLEARESRFARVGQRVLDRVLG